MSSRWLPLVGMVVVGCHGSKVTSPAPGEPALCAGQTSPPPGAIARSGPMEQQLAPGFLDKMPACSAAAATVPADQVVADAGAVTDKGDCAWPNGVACHFHLGVEFVASGVPRPKLAELHCIFPVATDPKSPRVFGTHFACKAGTKLPAAPADHQARTGAACGAGLLPALAAIEPRCDARCCEDGTLTNPTEQRRESGKLDVRPDFRICAATQELDCEALAAMIGHPANAPVYGPPIEDTL